MLATEDEGQFVDCLLEDGGLRLGIGLAEIPQQHGELVTVQAGERGARLMGIDVRRTVACAFALSALLAGGDDLATANDHGRLPSGLAEGVGALSTLQRGYRADACFIPEPTNGTMIRSQVGVIWFRLKVRGFPVHVFEAGAGSNAIMAAYHLVHALEKLKIAWNERGRADKYFKDVNHPINFNPGIIKGGDWASSVPASASSRIRSPSRMRPMTPPSLASGVT